MSSSPNKWMAYLDDGILNDPHQPHSLYCCGVNEQADFSMDSSCSRPDVSGREKGSSEKRTRDESSGGPSSKACREKVRRDRLKDRFLELGALLEPGKTLTKSDKSVILSDTLWLLQQLKTEAQQLNHSNETLRENIKKLKTEKNELRDEKQRLRVEKERLEQQMKLTMLPSGYFPHPAAMHAAMAAFAQTQPANGKGVSVPGHLGMGMWQWMPAAALDTTQDHMLRPPVA